MSCQFHRFFSSSPSPPPTSPSRASWPPAPKTSPPPGPASNGRSTSFQAHNPTPTTSTLTVLVTGAGATSFVGTHSSLTHKKRGDSVVSLNNFNSYHDPSLKHTHTALASHSIFIIDDDNNDARLLSKSRQRVVSCGCRR